MISNMKKIKYLLIVFVLGLCFNSNAQDYKPNKGAPKKKAQPLLSPNIEAQSDTLRSRISSVKNLQPTSGIGKLFPRKSDLKIFSMCKGDSVILRWAADTPGGWITANKQGIVIERFEIGSEESTSSLIMLTDKPLFPWSLDKWKADSDKKDRNAAVAAQCLYGKSSIKELGNNSAQNGFVQDLRYAAMELNNRYGFALFTADIDAHAADGLALRFVDRKIVKGKIYSYRVSVSSQDSAYYISPAFTIINTSEDTPFPAAPVISSVQGYDKKVKLIWKNTNDFSAFNIYRSDISGKYFVKLNSAPIAAVLSDKSNEDPEISDSYTGVFEDTTAENKVLYKYRLKGINMFAVESSPAEIEAKAELKSAPEQPLVRAEQIGKKTVKIKWEMKNSNSLSGFVVSKSNNFEINFVRLHKKLIDKNVREFVDSNANEEEPYYMISAVDTNGMFSMSLPFPAVIIDSTPPAKPNGLKAEIDSAGIVILSWNLGSEINLSGYHILRAFDPAHEFIQIAPNVVQDTLFADSINIYTLSHNVYYKIIALSTRYIPSQVSDIIQVGIPDIVNPSPALLNECSVLDEGIKLQWKSSSSDDAVKQNVLRKFADKNAKWQVIAELQLSQNTFTDSKAESTGKYIFAIETIDKSGLRSVSNLSPVVKPRPNKILFSPINMTAVYLQKDQKNVLKWESKSVFPPDAYIVIYREFTDMQTNKSAGKQIIASVKPGSQQYEDNMIIGKGIYKYYIRIMTEKSGSDVHEFPIVKIN